MTFRSTLPLLSLTISEFSSLLIRLPLDSYLKKGELISEKVSNPQNLSRSPSQYVERLCCLLCLTSS